MMFRVFHDHKLVAELDASSAVHVDADSGALIVTEPGAAPRTFPAGTWHAADVDAICGYVDANPACPHCHPPAEPAAEA